jgi:Replication initiator protein A
VPTPKPAQSLLPATTTGNAALAPQSNFVKIEKNLNSLGFFTPARHNGKEPREKIVTVRREMNGRIIEAQATILPSAKYGLPTTADLDKYLAFQKLVEQIRNRTGQITNPFGFTTAQLVNVLGINTTGKNYQDVHDWLQRMTLTGINSKDVVYMAKRRAWMSDTFHVFERVVTVGSVMPDGSVADRNYVWLSEWQLENINGNYLLPIDFETYRLLRNQIAKILVPLLQVWLYASRAEGRFEKRYSELCQILDITRHKHLSLIKRQLEPSLSELQHHGYLSSYSIEPTADGREYKVVAAHGHKFYRDQKVRAALPVAAKQSTGDQEPSALKELTSRGITESQARRLLRSLPESYPVLDQLEYADYLIGKAGGKIVNPPGFYTWVLRENLRPPSMFETSSKRRARQEGEELRLKEQMELLKRQEAYDQYCRDQVETHAKGMSGSQYQQLITKHIRQVKTQWRELPQQTIEEIARRQADDEIRQNMNLMGFDQFCANPQARLFD